MTTNAELFARRQAAIVRGVGNASPISAARALNSEIWDVEGKRYVDFGGGIAVLNTGHCHPRVDGSGPQADRELHPYLLPGADVRALYRARRAPQRARADLGAGQVRFCSPPARRRPKTPSRSPAPRPAVRASSPSRAGSMAARIMAMSMTGKVDPYKKGLGPSVPEVWHVPFPVPQHDVTVEDSLKYLSFLFKADIDPSRVAAIIIEPVQGEGGFHAAPVGADARACAASATSTASSSSRTKCRPVSAAPARCSRWSITTSRPT